MNIKRGIIEVTLTRDEAADLIRVALEDDPYYHLSNLGEGIPEDFTLESVRVEESGCVTIRG